MSAEPLIDIDERPEIVLEVDATVEEREGLPRIIPYDPSRWLSTLTRMMNTPVVVSFSRAKKRRSNEANRYLWGGVYRDVLAGLRGIAQDAREGQAFENKDQLHDFMKFRFLGTGKVTIKGVEYDCPARSSKLTTGEFHDYVQQVKAFVAERWQIYVREPGEGIAA